MCVKQIYMLNNEIKHNTAYCFNILSVASNAISTDEQLFVCVCDNHSWQYTCPAYAYPYLHQSNSSGKYDCNITQEI